MRCVILVAGHEATLEADIRNDASGCFQHLEGVPKALLPGADASRRIIDFWWQLVRHRQLFSQVFLVTNADKFKHFERWATASDFPAENVVNDGTTSHEARLGAVADLDLCLRTKFPKEDDGQDVLVVAGDMMFQVGIGGF